MQNQQLGSFDFEESGDVAANLKESFAVSNRGDDRAYNIMQRNWETDIRTSDDKWAKLAKWAPTVTKAMGKVALEHDNAKKAQVHLWYLHNGPEGLEKDKADKEQFDREGREMFKDLYEKTKDEPWHVRKHYLDMTKYERGLVDDIDVQRGLESYSPWTDPQVGNAVAVDEMLGALEAYDQKFYEQYGDKGARYIYDNVTTPLKERRSAFIKKWNTEREKDFNEQQIGLAKDKVNSAIAAESSSSWLDFNAQTRGYYGSDAESKNEYFKHTKTLISQGQLNEARLNAIGDQIIGGELVDGVLVGGKKLRDHHAFQGQFKDLQNDQITYENQESKRFIAKITGYKIRQKMAILAKVKTSDPLDDSQYAQWQSEWLEKTGEKGDWIEHLRSQKSVQGLFYNKMDKTMTELAEIGQLTEAFLTRDYVPQGVVKKHLATAQAQDKGKKTDFRTKQTFLDLAKYKVSKDKHKHPTVTALGEKMYARYLVMKKFMEEGGIVDDGQTAFDRINKWFLDARNTDGFYSHQGYKLEMFGDDGWKKDDVSLNVIGGGFTKDTIDNRKYILNAIGSLRGKALDTKMKPEPGEEPSTVFGPKSWVEDVSKGFGSSKFQIHPRLKFIADNYRDEDGHKLHPLAVLSKLRVVVGLDPLGTTDQEILYNRLSAKSKASVQRNNSNSLDINARARLEIFDPDPKVEGDEYIMKSELPDYKQVDDAAKGNGLETASVAAAKYAIEAGLDLEKVKTPGTPEYIKFQQWRMSLSGNKDIKQDALSKTRRPGILEFLAAPWSGQTPEEYRAGKLQYQSEN